MATNKIRTNMYIKIPNEKTQQAMKEAKAGKNMEKITLEDLKKIKRK